MDILTLDWETYYAQDYSLSSMTTEAYIRDSRFEEILIGVKLGDSPAIWLLPDRAAAFLAEEVDWANTALVTHHAHFDGAILNWKHGVKPALHIDTLSMARVLDGPKAGNSLHDLCIRHNVGVKGDYVTYAKGKHLKDFSRDELYQYGQYCCNDCDRTYDLAQIFLDQMPGDELRLIDLTIRMFTEPVFVGDSELLRSAVASERQHKIELLQQQGLLCPHCQGSGAVPDLIAGSVVCKKCDGMGVDKKPINSNAQFAELLRKLGAEPEMKPSPTVKDANGNPEMIFAFAKTDSYMQGLVEDEDDAVRTLAETRLSVKSNIIETRAAKFAACAERGPMPVYLAHAGAHTLRPSGGDGMNWLNMSKHNSKRPEMMVLRQSIQAPPGYKILAPDSGQGEARIVAWLSNQADLVEAFAQGRDIYSEAATDIYRRPVDRRNVKEDYIAGQVGKIEILSFGFGSGYYTASLGFLKGVLGAPPIQFTKTDMDTMRIDPNRMLNNPKKVKQIAEMPSRMSLNDRLIHCCVVDGLVRGYRERYAQIPKFWSICEQAINAMIRGEEMVFGAHGVLHTGHECIHLPNGTKLNYRGIERDEHGDATYWDGRKRTKIYGSLTCENVVQALHRAIVAEQMLRIADEGIKIALWPYDEVVAVVPANAAELSLQFMVQEMKVAPSWATGLPLNAEGKIGNTYAEC